MASIMLKRKILQLLKDGSKNTSEIYTYLNDNTRHGVSMNQLGNILAKAPEIKKTGLQRVLKEIQTGSHENAIWTLNDTEHVD